jgi:clan AA aspartic protease
VGHVVVPVRLSAKRSATVRMLVDTGATYTVLPPEVVRRIGAAYLPGRLAITLVDGRKRRVPVCAVKLRLGDREAAAAVVVLAGADPLLGVETLETLGLRVNPPKRRLEPTRRSAALLVGVR